MDLMKTVTERAQNTLSAKEQLHELNEQKKLDLENSLLKEALAESSERCERLLREFGSLQQTAEENRQKEAERNHQTIEELSWTVQQLQSGNELLEKGMSREIGALCDELQRGTLDKVNSLWSDYQTEIERKFNSIIRMEEEVNARLGQQVREVEAARRRLFRFDGLKSALFWIGLLANIATCLMLVLEKVLH